MSRIFTKLCRKFGNSIGRAALERCLSMRALERHFNDSIGRSAAGQCRICSRTDKIRGKTSTELAGRWTTRL
jgi:hypothetical protein